jgi:hypothetical protein
MSMNNVYFNGTGEFAVDEDDVIKWVADNKYPGDVFSEKELIEWAVENGFIHEDEIE